MALPVVEREEVDPELGFLGASLIARDDAREI